MDLLNRIEDTFSSMSKGQKKIAEYITSNYDKAVFMTAAKMGKVVGVSESTVVRFATLLGYDGYPGLLVAMEDMVSNKLKTIKKIELSKDRVSKQELLESVLKSDMDKISNTLNSIDSEAFELALNIIDSSRKIYICGIRSCMPLASFLGFYLSMIYDNVVVINTNSLSEIFEQMLRIDNQDCFIGISFPRYSMRTLKAMEFANDKNARVIALTDNIHSPMCLYSSCNLVADSEFTSIVDSLVAPLSVINAIIASLFMKNYEKAVMNIEELEALWEDYQVYANDDIDVFKKS
jgi:DNA-binding MurR/RpiR family transcriptional regulator